MSFMSKLSSDVDPEIITEFGVNLSKTAPGVASKFRIEASRFGLKWLGALE